VHPVAALLTVSESLAEELGVGLVNASPVFGSHRIDAPSVQQVEVAKATLGFNAHQFAMVQKAARAAVEALPA
jgi:hypothetical protein